MGGVEEVGARTRNAAPLVQGRFHEKSGRSEVRPRENKGDGVAFKPPPSTHRKLKV